MHDDRLAFDGAGHDAAVFDLITFDLDGTLVDTAAEIAMAANRALADHGIAPRPADEIERLIGAGTRELMLKLLARVFLEQPALVERIRVDAVMADLDRHYAATAGRASRAYPGADATLRRLGDAGVRLACVTNKERRHADRVLEATGLGAHFGLVIGGDSLPEKKPHPSVLRSVSLAFGVPPHRAAHVGDSGIDVRAARHAGFAAWAVPWGYNAGTPVADEGPDRLFAHLPDIASHVLAARAPSPGGSGAAPR